MIEILVDLFEVLSQNITMSIAFQVNLLFNY